LLKIHPENCFQKLSINSNRLQQLIWSTLKILKSHFLQAIENRKRLNCVNEKMIVKAPFITRRLHLGLPALWWRCAERRKVSCRGALTAAPAIGGRRPQSRRHCMPAVAANPCAPASSSVLGFPANFLTQKLGGKIYAGVAAATSALSQLKRTGRRLSVHPFHLRPLVDNVGVYRCT
jgi:hypothetical protein